MSLYCSKCTYNAPSYYKLQQHIQKEHNNVVYKCDECNKLFVSKLGLDKHKSSVCSKIHSVSPLECKYCFQVFNNRSTKCRHMKVCQCRPDNEVDCALVVQVVETVRPVVFETRVSKCTQFITSHITNDDMKSIIFDYYNEKKKHRHLFVFLEYAKRILRHTDNRCIIKPNIKIPSSKIHTGNGEWERYADDDVMEKLRIDIARSFMKQLEGIEDESKHIITKRIHSLRGQLEFLTDDVFDDEHNAIIVETKYVRERIINFVLAR